MRHVSFSFYGKVSPRNVQEHAHAADLPFYRQNISKHTSSPVFPDPPELQGLLYITKMAMKSGNIHGLTISGPSDILKKYGVYVILN
jgi:hypothetical protein